MQSFSDAGEKVLVKDYNSKGLSKSIIFMYCCTIHIHIQYIQYNKCDLGKEHVINYILHLIFHIYYSLLY